MACTNKNNCLTACNGQPEKICIQVKRVFDAAISQSTQEDAVLTVTFETGTPTSFVSAESNGDATVTSLVVTPQPESCNSRVQYTVNVPIGVTALDATGATIVGTANLALSQDILLRVPQGAVIPAEIQVTAKIISTSGTLVGTTLTLDYCVTLITRVVADVDILVQSLGYPNLPLSQPYTEDMCEGLFRQPIYPR